MRKTEFPTSEDLIGDHQSTGSAKRDSRLEVTQKRLWGTKSAQTRIDDIRELRITRFVRRN